MVWKSRTLEMQSMRISVLLRNYAANGAPECIEWQTWTRAIQPTWTAHIADPQFNLASLAITAALNHQGVASGLAALIDDELRTGLLVRVMNAYVVAPAR